MNMKANLRYIAVITALLYILMLFPGAFIYAGVEDEGYKDGYTNGWIDGIEAGEIDYANSDRKSYSRSMPSYDEIIDEFNLEKEPSPYRSDFISGYRAGFKEGYNMGYDSSSSKEEPPTDYAETLGFDMGTVNGYMDYYAGKANKWTNTVPNTTKIIDYFDLKKEPNDYKNSFIAAFKKKYKEGYEERYRKAKFEPFKTATEKGASDGTSFGGLLGANYGRKDYYDGITNDYSRDILTDKEIKTLFMLKNDMEDYTKAFLSAFKYEYRVKYEEAYRKANADYFTMLFGQGYDQGLALGTAKGKSNAQIDLLMGRSNDENRYNYGDSQIINEYKLMNQHEKYRDGFISGFKEGSKSGYMAAYQAENFENFATRVITQIVPVAGAQIVSGDHKILFNIEKGIYYNDVAVYIDKILNTNTGIKLLAKERFTKASDFYTIKVVNSTESMDRDKSIKLSFEYYGPYGGGVYKYTNNGWKYLPSKIEANSISTMINPKAVNNKSAAYAVFIDTKAWNPNDIRGHWAKDEIVAYLRNGIAGVFGDNTFRPDVAINRAQLLTYMSRVYKWNLKSAEKNVAELESLEDYKEFEHYKELAAYCIKNGYLKVNEDNTLKLNSPVSYKEVERMMKIATGDKNFSWMTMAEKIIKNKDKRSKSFNSMDSFITRAEAVYMLFYMTE